MGGWARVVPDESPGRTLRRPGDGACDVTSAPTVQDTRSPATPDAPPRLRLKPDTKTATGQVDGGWWPRSTDLAAELPELLSGLAPLIGRVERVGYHLADWGPTPRRIHFDGALVRLGGYNWQPAATVDVLTDRRTLTLLVVPPDTPPPAAQNALTAAAAAENADSVEALLASGGLGEASSARRRRSRGDRVSRRQE